MDYTHIYIYIYIDGLYRFNRLNRLYILVGGDWNMTFIFHILGISSSQLPFIFFGGVEPPTSDGFKAIYPIYPVVN